MQQTYFQNPRDISISDYRYDLPSDRIASEPLAERDDSKLLIYRDERIRETVFRNLAEHLPQNGLLVFNDTKVVEARILFFKPSGAQIEIFCLEPPAADQNMPEAMQRQSPVRWKCLIGGASKWKPGQVLKRELPVSGSEKGWLEARWIGKEEDAFLIELSWSPDTWNFAEMLHHAGLIPLPPYIHRPSTELDRERYQTVYAAREGSVAAPTAGLHFNNALMDDLTAKGLKKDFVTLHVGAGTFMPVKHEKLGEHVMHAEWIHVRRAVLENLLSMVSGKRAIIPIGTTSLRTIESLYWLGLKTIRHPGIMPEELVVGQWDPYQEDDTGPIDTDQALRALMGWMDRQGCPTLFTRTRLLITPGYPWRLTDALITNFHQPESTLLLLVAALAGPAWKDIYRYALEHGFRFLSYGDGSLLFRPKPKP